MKVHRWGGGEIRQATLLKRKNVGRNGKKKRSLGTSLK